MPIALTTRRSAPPTAPAYGHGFALSRPSAAAAPATLTDCLMHIQESGARLHFVRDESIFRQDDPAEHVYRIVSGTVRLCRYRALRALAAEG